MEAAAEPSQLAKLAIKAADDKQAIDIVALEVGRLLGITDYFVICSGGSDRQVRTIAENVRRQLRTGGQKPISAVGEEQGRWILLDYGSVVVHIFDEELREYYQLERLWKDAPRLAI